MVSSAFVAAKIGFVLKIGMGCKVVASFWKNYYFPYCVMFSASLPIYCVFSPKRMDKMM